MSTQQTEEREKRILAWADKQVGTAGWQTKLVNLIEEECTTAERTAREEMTKLAVIAFGMSQLDGKPDVKKFVKELEALAPSTGETDEDNECKHGAKLGQCFICGESF